jgi:hypothetical protein
MMQQQSADLKELFIQLYEAAQTIGLTSILELREALEQDIEEEDFSSCSRWIDLMTNIVQTIL